MTSVIDQTSDTNGQQLYRLSKLYPLPPFVKSASSADICGYDELENHQYADPVSRRFPCHTASATYISTLFFMDKRAQLEDGMADLIEARLDDFAFMHGINERIDEIKTKVAESQKPVQLADDDYAIVISDAESPTGKKEKHYPLRNALEVKKAAELLHEHVDTIPYKYRQRMATKILERADSFGAGLGDLDEFLHKQAGHGACSGLDAAELLKTRATLLRAAKQTEYATRMDKLAQAFNDKPVLAHDTDTLVKLAAIIDQVDKEAHLAAYVSDLTRPEDVFFNITEKAASTLRNEHVATASGNIYKICDMDNLKLADVKQLLGEEFADAISTNGLYVTPEKMAAVLPTLQRDDADLVDSLLAAAGIHPVAKEAAHDAVILKLEDYRELAKLRKVVS